MYAINSHSYTHLILALDIVREPTIWGFITKFSQYPGIHDIGCLYYNDNVIVQDLASYWDYCQPTRSVLHD